MAPGDPEDVEKLLSQRDFMHGLAVSLLADPGLGEDLEQQTWLAILPASPRDLRSPRAWLATLVRNLASKRWLGEGRRAKSGRGLPSPAPIPTPPVEGNR